MCGTENCFNIAPLLYPNLQLISYVCLFVNLMIFVSPSYSVAIATLYHFQLLLYESC